VGLAAMVNNDNPLTISALRSLQLLKVYSVGFANKNMIA
jgi:hypothetical protein